MPDYLRALVAILFIAGTVFVVARGPACAQAMAAADFQRRRNLWLAVTLVAFLAHHFWLFVVVTALLLLLARHRDPNPPALFFFLLFAVPALASEISALGLARQLFVLNYPRLLSLTVLLPAALVLAAEPRQKSPASAWLDALLAAYILLTLALQLTVDTATNTLRYGFYYGMDMVLPYYVASRAIRSRQDFRDALMSFVVAAMVLAAIGIFEFGKHWLLYASLDNRLGLEWAYGAYLERGGSLRALATTGQPIALGFVIAVACGLFLYLRPAVPRQASWFLGLFLLLAGLVAPLSRGPWLGAALGFAAFVATGPAPWQNLSRLLMAGLIAVPIALATPLGDILIEHLPFLGGALDTDTVDYRERLLEMSLDIIRHNPWFGSFDFLNYLEDLRQGQGIIDVVNTYLGIALASGLTGLGLFAAFFAGLAVRLFRALGAATDGEERLLGRALFATLIGILVTIFTVSSITVIPIVYWSVAGLGLAYLRRLERQAAPAPARPAPAAPGFAGLEAWGPHP